MNVIIADDREDLQLQLKSALCELAPQVDFKGISELAGDTSGNTPGLLILDLAGDGAYATDIIAEWRRNHPDVPVLVLADGLATLGEGKAGRLADAVLPRSAGLEGIRAVVARVNERRIQEAESGLNAQAAAGPAKLLEALTKRESEVLALLAQGFSNRDIADALGLREITVKVHLKSVYRKLGVKSRTQAVRVAMDAANGRKRRRKTTTA
ncbi:MAG: response regulator transcription factor [Rhodospirillales bacterium]